MRDKDLLKADNNIKDALTKALELEFQDVPNAENFEYSYSFSKEYRSKMKELSKVSEYQYVSVGSRRMRKAVALALIVTMLVATTVCAAAISKVVVNWLESQNDDQGTLDVYFDVEYPDGVKPEFKFVEPEVPEGYSITEREYYGDEIIDIYYSNADGNRIFYSQNIGIETIGISIDNDDPSFKEIEINGYKGYCKNEDGDSFIIWTDGNSLFQLVAYEKQLDILVEMAESIE